MINEEEMACFYYIKSLYAAKVALVCELLSPRRTLTPFVISSTFYLSNVKNLSSG